MVQDIELKPSPFWMRYRLYVSDVRAINNIVDITNYVLMELGQPLHAFDYERLRGHQIIVAKAKNGDTFSTLDGQTHTLNSGHLMICDGERQVAMAGVMGGLNSEIFEGSKNVLIESAYFDPTTIRRGAKSVGLSTEASYRFERGIDIGGVEMALRRTLMFISTLAGGKVNKGIIDVYPEPKIPPLIDLRVTKANEFLGTSISKESIAGYLTALDMSPQDLDEETFKVQPPSYRVDLTREIDIVEEIARLEGYDNIPVTYPAISHSDVEEIPSLILRDKVSDIMTGLGFSEIITYSFISPDSVDLLGASDNSVLRSFVKLQNPLSIEQSVMRTSLLPGLLSTVRDNYAHGETEIMIYEWGNIFINRKDNDLPSENLFLSAVMTGNYENDDLHHRTRKVDFYDMKGAVEILLETIGFTGVLFKREKSESWYDPDISCDIYDSDIRIGSLGLVNSNVLEGFDIKAKEVYLCEVDIEALIKQMKGKSINFSPYSRFPAVVRDLSIIVDKGIESVRIRDIIRQEGRGLIESVKVFDVYEGEKVGNLKKALSFRICYRSKDSTLDGKVVNRLHDSVIKKVIKETGGALKEG
jgi:phenylalanyl-tRNA synthetase beta chain